MNKYFYLIIFNVNRNIKFDLCKKNALLKLQKCDKSPKGSLDEPIIELVHLINDENNFVTTSSCSGRIALFVSESKVYNINIFF